jgi:ABC-type nickel/cobalt efflux system permease component RcnA
VDPLALSTGFFFGLRHSLDPDHVAALAQFASAQPAPRRGLVFGLRWGAGHAAAVMALGAFLVPAGLGLGSGYERAAERLVGLMLIGLAAWRLRSLLRAGHVHEHRHADGTVHAHPHRHGHGHAGIGHVHPHAPTLAGFVHGAAGVVGVLALLPLSGGGALERALLIAAFAAGSLLSMGLFGALAGRLYAALGARGRAQRLAAAATALAGLALGALWLARAA